MDGLPVFALGSDAGDRHLLPPVAQPVLEFSSPMRFRQRAPRPPRQVAQGVRRVEHAVGKSCSACPPSSAACARIARSRSSKRERTLVPTPSLPSNSTLSATNCNASAKTSRSAGARGRQRPDPRRCRLLRPTSEDGRGVSPGMAAKGDWGCRPFPLMQSPSPRPTGPTTGFNLKPQSEL